MLAGNCAVPLTSVLLLFELTRDYLIILPTLAAVGIAFWLSGLLAPRMRSAARNRAALAAAAPVLAEAAAAIAAEDSTCLIFPLSLPPATALWLLQRQAPDMALLPAGPVAGSACTVLCILWAEL